jgi:hypothetical protein
VSTQPTPPAPTGILDKLMLIIESATVLAAALPATSEYAQLALQVEQIAQAAITAHEQITGQPYRPDLLQPITPVS